MIWFVFRGYKGKSKKWARRRSKEAVRMLRTRALMDPSIEHLYRRAAVMGPNERAFREHVGKMRQREGLNRMHFTCNPEAPDGTIEEFFAEALEMIKASEDPAKSKPMNEGIDKFYDADELARELGSLKE